MAIKIIKGGLGGNNEELSKEYRKYLYYKLKQYQTDLILDDIEIIKN